MQQWKALYSRLETPLGRRVLGGKPGNMRHGARYHLERSRKEERIKSDRLTRSVIDFEFLVDDYQNPEASG